MKNAFSVDNEMVAYVANAHVRLLCKNEAFINKTW